MLAADPGHGSAGHGHHQIAGVGAVSTGGHVARATWVNCSKASGWDISNCWNTSAAAAWARCFAHGYHAEPRRGGEGAFARAIGRRRNAAAVSERSAIGGPAGSRKHQPRVLRRRGSAAGTTSSSSSSRDQSTRLVERQGALPLDSSRELHAANCRRAGARQPARRGASRHQAFERADHARPASEAGRHGPGAVASGGAAAATI